MCKFTITESSNGKPILQLNGYELRHGGSNKNGTTRWRCLKKGCKATILMKDEEIVSQSYSHCHQPDETACNNRIIDAHMRCRCRREMTKTIPEMYEEVRAEVKVNRPDVYKSLPTYGSWQARLYREGAKLVPKLSTGNGHSQNQMKTP